MSASSSGPLDSTPSMLNSAFPVVTSISSLTPDKRCSLLFDMNVDIDCKKRSKSESAAFDFHIKKVFAYGVDNDILEEIHKFPLPFQQLLIKKACAVMNRLEKGKGVPGLTSLNCHCLFAIDIY
ncbi:36965_t:CDS:2 [Gigaspora margarita]|uniref:36965_t:CDS:1 n=1 Tax=Gigaspora margarita TaxID=4874 RepID=A0ABN7V0V7_GIGMA|nr:36965_t:CDS:2 [Gigaspora margarita]